MQPYLHENTGSQSTFTYKHCEVIIRWTLISHFCSFISFHFCDPLYSVSPGTAHSQPVWAGEKVGWPVLWSGQEAQFGWWTDMKYLDLATHTMFEHWMDICWSSALYISCDGWTMSIANNCNRCNSLSVKVVICFAWSCSLRCRFAVKQIGTSNAWLSEPVSHASCLTSAVFLLFMLVKSASNSAFQLYIITITYVTASCSCRLLIVAVCCRNFGFDTDKWYWLCQGWRTMKYFTLK